MTTLMKYSKPQNGMLNILDHFFDDELFNWNTPEKTIIPNYDIVETENEYLVEFGLAGFTKEDVSLNIEDDILTIEGERKSDENIRYTRKGNFYGKFRKTFTLPDNVMTDKIGASWKDGMLRITIPKDEKTKLSKSIEIT
jgi:HSP20 family protein